jgi:hypothetical protein
VFKTAQQACLIYQEHVIHAPILALLALILTIIAQVATLLLLLSIILAKINVQSTPSSMKTFANPVNTLVILAFQFQGVEHVHLIRQIKLFYIILNA